MFKNALLLISLAALVVVLAAPYCEVRACPDNLDQQGVHIVP